MNKAFLFCYILTLFLMGCSSGPYPEIKRGLFVKIYLNDKTPPRYGEVSSKTSESITLNQGIAFEVYPWSSIHHVELATPVPSQ